MIGGTLRLLAEQWSLVIAAKGESDEREMIKDFQDSLKHDVYQELDRADGCGEEAVAAADLQAETAFLAAGVIISSNTGGKPPGDDQYDKVASKGNTLLDQMGVSGARFIKAKCHGHVDETTNCTALTE
jgi:hypothetical protein